MDRKEKIDLLKAEREQALLGGGAEKVARQHKAGKLTARERLDILLDPGTFEEHGMFITPRSVAFAASEKKSLRRWGGHRIRPCRRAKSLCLCSGLYGHWRVPGGTACQEDLCRDGQSDRSRLASHRTHRFRRSKDPRKAWATTGPFSFGIRWRRGLFPRFPSSWDRVRGVQSYRPPWVISYSWWKKPPRCTFPDPGLSRNYRGNS